MKNYWIKDQTRQEIITKTLIPNKSNFEFFGTYFNLADCKGLSFQFKEKSGFERERLFIKNGFEYIVLQHENFNELLVLPNENLEILTDKIVSKINFCNNEGSVFDLILGQMN